VKYGDKPERQEGESQIAYGNGAEIAPRRRRPIFQEREERVQPQTGQTRPQGFFGSFLINAKKLPPSKTVLFTNQAGFEGTHITKTGGVG